MFSNHYEITPKSFRLQIICLLERANVRVLVNNVTSIKNIISIAHIYIKIQKKTNCSDAVPNGTCRMYTPFRLTMNRRACYDSKPSQSCFPNIYHLTTLHPSQRSTGHFRSARVTLNIGLLPACAAAHRKVKLSIVARKLIIRKANYCWSNLLYAKRSIGWRRVEDLSTQYKLKDDRKRIVADPSEGPSVFPAGVGFPRGDSPSRRAKLRPPSNFGDGRNPSTLFQFVLYLINI